MAICSGLLLKFVAQQVLEFRMFLIFISHSFLFVGIFFIIYTLVPLTDFSTSIYFISLFILSVALTFAAHFLHRAIFTTEQRLKSGNSFHGSILPICFKAKIKVESEDLETGNIPDWSSSQVDGES